MKLWAELIKFHLPGQHAEPPVVVGDSKLPHYLWHGSHVRFCHFLSSWLTSGRLKRGLVVWEQMMGRENAVALQTQRHCRSMQLPEYCTLACQRSYDKGNVISLWDPCFFRQAWLFKGCWSLELWEEKKDRKRKKAPVYCHCSSVGVFVKADRNVHGHFEWREHLPDILGAKNSPRDT